jgi:hypothetical protein
VKERMSVFSKPIPRWKTHYKRAVLWVFERRWLSVTATQKLLDLADARLA